MTDPNRWSNDEWQDWHAKRDASNFFETGSTDSNSSTEAGWICEMIANFYFPNAQLDRVELAMDVNYYFQSFGGIRQLPRQVSASDFSDRSLTRANDPKTLQFIWSNARRLYWLVYDVAPKFWQRQFRERALTASLLVRMIAAIVSVNPAKTPTSHLLITFTSRILMESSR